MPVAIIIDAIDRFVEFNPIAVTLSGESVTLAPLALSHASELFVAGQHAEMWRYLPIPPFKSLPETEDFIREALIAAAAGSEIPFVILSQATGQALGSTRYLDIRRPHRALEIGWTWLGIPFQRTAVNTEAKYLLLHHAFEDHGAVRVQLKTDERNLRSQCAIERIGAVREGVHRKQMTLWDGYIRNTVFYSITDEEWPFVKARLSAMLKSVFPKTDRSAEDI